jgi:hypothetical protein
MKDRAESVGGGAAGDEDIDMPCGWAMKNFRHWADEFGLHYGAMGSH